MSKCKGITGLLFGHDYEEIFDETAEYYELDMGVMPIAPGTPRNQLHGPTKKSSRIHQYCMCRRCGEQVSKERKSLFTKEDV